METIEYTFVSNNSTFILIVTGPFAMTKKLIIKFVQQDLGI